MTIAVITENTAAQNATEDDLYTGVVDTHIDENNSTTNYGTDAFLNCEKRFAGSIKHTLIRFDGLSNISASSTVSAATLYMYANNGSTTTIGVRQMLQAWTVGGATYDTYNGTNNWNTAGAQGAGTDRVSATEDTTVMSGSSGYQSFDVTSLVQDIIDGTVSSDEGFHLERTDGAEDGAPLSFIASDGTNSNRPELVVTYTAAATGTGKSNPLQGPLGGPLSGAIS